MGFQHVKVKSHNFSASSAEELKLRVSDFLHILILPLLTSICQRIGQGFNGFWFNVFFSVWYYQAH